MSSHFITCLILALYCGNVLWYGYNLDLGRSLYWLFAAGITVSATWLVK